MELTNQGRARHESVKRGNKFDGIVYSIHESTLEYGFIEVSKGALTSYDVKSIDERTKLITAMRAAIVHCSHVVEKEEDFRNHVMLSVRTSGMYYPPLCDMLRSLMTTHRTDHSNYDHVTG
jgi:3-dehydroquinate dehydratase